MDHGRRGIAVIFNQKHFYNRILVRRTGTKRDARNLINTLKSLGFDIWTHIDASYDTVVKTLKRGESNLICMFIYNTFDLKNCYTF